MKKQELLKLPMIKATKSMMQMAYDDVLKRKTIRYSYNSYVRDYYNTGLYMRCRITGKYFKIAFFLTENMRSGGNLPAYELYIDKEHQDFITYDRDQKKWLTAKLDMIQWPSYVFNSTNKWISQKGYDMIKDYLGVKQGGYAGLLEYQLRVRRDQLKRKHKRETDPWDLQLAQTPELPKDWEKWVAKVAIPEHFIFYHYVKKGATSGYCSYCDRDVPIKKPRHNKLSVCPRCRHTITFKALGRFGRFFTDTHFAYLIQRCDEGFVIREFRVHNCHLSKQYQKPIQHSFECRRAFYGKNAEPIGTYYWGDYKHTHIRWIKTSACGTDSMQDFSGRIYGKTLPDLARKEMKRTGIYEAVKSGAVLDPELYLAVWQKFPRIEQLAKSNLPRITRECTYNYRLFMELYENAHSSSLTKVLGIDALELRRLRKNRGGRKFLKWLQFEKVTQKVIPDHVITWFCQEGISEADVRFIGDRMRMEQIYNYVRRQMQEGRMKSKEVLTTWADYLSMAVRLGIDTSDEIIYRARKLKQRHDELVERCNQRKDLALKAGEILQKYPQVEEHYRAVKDIYSHADEEFTVLVPDRIEDIILEGEHLHHCVGSSDRYWDRVQRKESYVLFLRRTVEPEKAYYTLEVEPDGTVRQKRTMYDRQEADIVEATRFLRNWQKIVSKRLSEEHRQLAAASRTLRNLAFDDMRSQQVRINTGDLRGALLVDVLMADLMENTETEAALLQAAA